MPIAFSKYLFSNADDKQLLQALKLLLGFYPKNLLLYKQAFRHKSVASQIRNDFKDSNERLEYLGDAVLGSIVAEYLFTKYPYKNEGFLTKLRSRMVSRQSISALSSKMGIERFIQVSSDSQPSKTINGNALEALIGAVYLDVGYNKTKQFILKRIVSNHMDMDEIEHTDKDFKSKVVEWVQREKKTLKFEVVEEKGKNHEKYYIVNVIINEVVEGFGEGKSKKAAEQHASEIVCNKYNIN
ncbi:MAG: ribonuclease III [Bacteroidota bacterium]